jgi:RNA polymerase sigma-70 factor (ECF subfamily)
LTHSAETLVENHLDALYGLARAWTLDGDLAQELTHRTFLKAFERLGQLRKPEAARAWLVAILRNEIASEFRRRNREVEWDEGADEIPETVPEEGCREELLPFLPAAFERLSPACRDVLLLRFQQDLGYEDIARVMEVPTGTVMSRLHRAKAALRANLEGITRTPTGGTT